MGKVKQLWQDMLDAMTEEEQEDYLASYDRPCLKEEDFDND